MFGTTTTTTDSAQFKYEYDGKEWRANKLNLANIIRGANIATVGDNETDSIRMAQLIISALNQERIIISKKSEHAAEFSRLFPNDKIYRTVEESNIAEMLEEHSVAIRRKDFSEKTICLDLRTDTDASASMDAEVVRELMLNGRHYSFSVITMGSHAINLSPVFRLNFDYVFLLPEADMLYRKKIYKQYASIFHPFEQFEIIFDAFTKNNGVMVLAGRSQKDTFFDRSWHCSLNSVPTKSAQDHTMHHA